MRYSAWTCFNLILKFLVFEKEENRKCSSQNWAPHTLLAQLKKMCEIISKSRKTQLTKKKDIKRKQYHRLWPHHVCVELAQASICNFRRIDFWLPNSVGPDHLKRVLPCSSGLDETVITVKTFEVSHWLFCLIHSNQCVQTDSVMHP